jgi:hypothetical protein
MKNTDAVTAVTYTIQDLHVLCTEQHGPCPKKQDDPNGHRMWRMALRNARKFCRRQGTYRPRPTRRG